MRLWGVAAALVLFAGLGTPGALAAEACADGNPAAKPVAIDLTDQATRDGLVISFAFGFSPPETYPFGDIAKAQNPCQRGSFAVGNNTATLWGNGDLPPRWASIPGLSKIAFILCLMPRPSAALAAGENTAVKFSHADMMYAATLATENGRLVFAFYDDIPDDAALRTLAQSIMTGQAKLIAGLDTQTGIVSLP